MNPTQAQAFMSGFEWMATAAHNNSTDKGFWDARHKIELTCAEVGLHVEARKMIDSQLRELIVSEIAEACEGDRKDLQSDHIKGFSMVEEELADAIIRIGDYAAARELRVAEAVVAKMIYNAGREKMHGKKF